MCSGAGRGCEDGAGLRKRRRQRGGGEDQGYRWTYRIPVRDLQRIYRVQGFWGLGVLGFRVKFPETEALKPRNPKLNPGPLL